MKIAEQIFDKMEDIRKDISDKHVTVVKEIGFIREDMAIEIGKIKGDIRVQKVKSSAFGIIGGFIAHGAALLARLFMSNN